MRRQLERLTAATVGCLLVAGGSASSGDGPGVGLARVVPPTTVAAPAVQLPGPLSAAAPAGVVRPVVPDVVLSPLPLGPPKVLVTPTGVTVAIVDGGADGPFTVTTPCGRTATVADGIAFTAAHVVIDPGHGGVETGAVGPGGTEEKNLNLDVSDRIAAILRDKGATVVLTRTGDYRIPLGERTKIATALRPGAFVSIHFNAEPDGPSEGPGTETYHQIAGAESRRLAGLIWESTSDALEQFDIPWVADTDAGAKFRKNTRGTDYYGILRQSTTLAGVLAEIGFLSNEPEEQLYANEEVRNVIAASVAAAILRFLTTEDPGSGYVEPYPRTTPAGPGGGSSGCVDPPLV